MKPVRIPPAQIQTQYVQFRGGIDVATPLLSLKPGNALEAMNYEPGLLGGYRRIDGFERIDGRPAPSNASYIYLEATVTAPIKLDDIVTGATSGATGRVINVHAPSCSFCLVKTTGVFALGEQIKVNGAVVATLTSAPAARGARTAKADAIALAAAADVYRADIGPVPGRGPIRGVWMYQAALYAWRDIADGTACAMYIATAGGWTVVALGEEVAFTNANASMKEGLVLSQASTTATATVARFMLQTGSLQSGVNTGRMVLTGRSAANFAAGAATTTTGGGTLTLGGPATAIKMAPGGRFEFINANLGGSTSTFRMYGCDGKNRAFEFDGTVFAPIATGMTLDTPSFLCEHKKKLFLAFGASVQFSGDGNPYQWTIVAGAGEIGTGDNVTGFAVQAGDTLAIYSRNSSNQLNGATTNSFQMLPISKEVGAIGYTVQTIGKTFGMDDRGIVSTDRTQSYGNFVQSTLSAMVQPIIDQLRGRVVGSTVYRSRGQYRIYASDGSGIIVAFGEAGLLGITQLQYPVKPTCFASCEDATGKDNVYFGADNGFVYQADVGSSFDGATIEAYLRMPFNNVGGPRIRKRFRKAVLEMSATGHSLIRFQPEFSYGDPDVGTHRLQGGEVTGAGGYWDSSSWDSFFYDARVINNPAFSIEGTGLNMALLFYSASVTDLGHVLQGMQIHFTPRRLER